MSMVSEVMKLIFVVLDLSFNSGHHTVVIKRQFLYIDLDTFLPLIGVYRVTTHLFRFVQAEPHKHTRLQTVVPSINLSYGVSHI